MNFVYLFGGVGLLISGLSTGGYFLWNGIASTGEEVVDKKSDITLTTEKPKGKYTFEEGGKK